MNDKREFSKLHKAAQGSTHGSNSKLTNLKNNPDETSKEWNAGAPGSVRHSNFTVNKVIGLQVVGNTTLERGETTVIEMTFSGSGPGFEDELRHNPNNYTWWINSPDGTDKQEGDEYIRILTTDTDSQPYKDDKGRTYKITVKHVWNMCDPSETYTPTIHCIYKDDINDDLGVDPATGNYSASYAANNGYNTILSTSIIIKGIDVSTNLAVVGPAWAIDNELWKGSSDYKGLNNVTRSTDGTISTAWDKAHEVKLRGSISATSQFVADSISSVSYKWYKKIYTNSSEPDGGTWTEITGLPEDQYNNNHIQGSTRFGSIKKWTDNANYATVFNLSLQGIDAGDIGGFSSGIYKLETTMSGDVGVDTFSCTSVSGPIGMKILPRIQPFTLSGNGWRCNAASTTVTVTPDGVSEDYGTTVRYRLWKIAGGGWSPVSFSGDTTDRNVNDEFTFSISTDGYYTLQCYHVTPSTYENSSISIGSNVASRFSEATPQVTIPGTSVMGSFSVKNISTPGAPTNLRVLNKREVGRSTVDITWDHTSTPAGVNRSYEVYASSVDKNNNTQVLQEWMMWPGGSNTKTFENLPLGENITFKVRAVFAGDTSEVVGGGDIVTCGGGAVASVSSKTINCNNTVSTYNVTDNSLLTGHHGSLVYSDSTNAATPEYSHSEARKWPLCYIPRVNQSNAAGTSDYTWDTSKAVRSTRHGLELGKVDWLASYGAGNMSDGAEYQARYVKFVKGSNNIWYCIIQAPPSSTAMTLSLSYGQSKCWGFVPAPASLKTSAHDISVVFEGKTLWIGNSTAGGRQYHKTSGNNSSISNDEKKFTGLRDDTDNCVLLNWAVDGGAGHVSVDALSYDGLARSPAGITVIPDEGVADVTFNDTLRTYSISNTRQAVFNTLNLPGQKTWLAGISTVDSAPLLSPTGRSYGPMSYTRDITESYPSTVDLPNSIEYASGARTADGDGAHLMSKAWGMSGTNWYEDPNNSTQTEVDNMVRKESPTNPLSTSNSGSYRGFYGWVNDDIGYHHGHTEYDINNSKLEVTGAVAKKFIRVVSSSSCAGWGGKAGHCDHLTWEVGPFGSNNHNDTFKFVCHMYSGTSGNWSRAAHEAGYVSNLWAYNLVTGRWRLLARNHHGGMTNTGSMKTTKIRPDVVLVGHGLITAYTNITCTRSEFNMSPSEFFIVTGDMGTWRGNDVSKFRFHCGGTTSLASDSFLAGKVHTMFSENLNPNRANARSDIPGGSLTGQNNKGDTSIL